MKKHVIKGAMLLLSAFTFLGGVQLPDVSAADTIGNAIQYDKSVKVNDDKEIKLEYWTWNEGDPAITLATEYSDIHPNVTIDVKIQPWDDYWTKLPLSLKGKEGPAIFNIHNSQHSLLMNYLAPYDIPTKDLEEDYTGVAAHVIDDKVYYIDNVINTGTIYYNKKLWEKAGLTDADIPTTWDQFREVAKKLTVKDGDKLVQAGFNFNGTTYSAIYQGLNYQKGALLFKEDATTANYNNETTIENMQFLKDLYDVDGVGSKDFGTDDTQSFGNEQTAMVYKWGWFVNELATKYPDVEYGVFATPTFSEETPFAYDRYNGESTPGINKNQSAEQQAVAQDFIKFILANDAYSLAAAQSYASFPTKKSLVDHEEVLANPVLAVLAPRVEKLIWAGPIPATLETSTQKAFEEVIYNGADIKQAVEEAQNQIERDMRRSDFKSLESSYK